MTTWTSASSVSTTYNIAADLPDGYVAVGYVENDYIQPEEVWTDSTAASTTWTQA